MVLLAKAEGKSAIYSPLHFPARPRRLFRRAFAMWAAHGERVAPHAHAPGCARAVGGRLPLAHVDSCPVNRGNGLRADRRRVPEIEPVCASARGATHSPLFWRLIRWQFGPAPTAPLGGGRGSDIGQARPRTRGVEGAKRGTNGRDDAAKRAGRDAGAYGAARGCVGGSWRRSARPSRTARPLRRKRCPASALRTERN